MELLYLDSVGSTHTYLKEYIKKNGFSKPVAVYTNYQTDGIGSRNNKWEGNKGNLFFSFVIDKESLPNDLAFQSASIYFSYILKEVLKEEGSNLWLKWPNDFYISEKKIGGTITNLSGNLFYCGIGINLHPVSDEFGYLDIEIDNKNLLETYFKELEKYISWKQIFSKFQVEFSSKKNYKTTINNEKISLENAILNDDGSLLIEGEKVFSLR
jgi:BirA family biotin operon repressor/biotin-[acetyl-CoA-carboxylase] ligase